MKVRGLNCTSQLANFFETLTLPLPGQGETTRIVYDIQPA